MQYNSHVTMQYNNHVPMQYNNHVPMQYNSHVPMQYNNHVPMQYNSLVPMQYNSHAPMQYNSHVQCYTTVTSQCNTTVTSCKLVSSIRYRLTCAYSDDSNQSVHPPSLIRVVVFRLKKCFGLKATHIAHIEDSDQTARMRRLTCVFDGRTCRLVPFAGNTVILLDKSFLPSQTAS